MVSLNYDAPRTLQGRPKLLEMRRHPDVCQRTECTATKANLYCRRCILDLKARLTPGMSAREIEQFYTGVGRTRALTEAESVVLEEAVRSQITNSRKRSA